MQEYDALVVKLLARNRIFQSSYLVEATTLFVTLRHAKRIMTIIMKWDMKYSCQKF